GEHRAGEPALLPRGGEVREAARAARVVGAERRGEDREDRPQRERREQQQDRVIGRALGAGDHRRSPIRATARLIAKMMIVSVTPTAAAEPTSPSRNARL